MTRSVYQVTILSSVLTFSATGAFAAGMLAAPNGMTLYTFDKDTSGMSACYDDCAKKWPPFLGKADEKMPEGWALLKRTDGKMQWTYEGKPTYFFAGDTKAGNAAGDGKGGMWHIIKE